MSKPNTLPMDWKKYQDANECGCVLCGKKLPARAYGDKGVYIHIGQGGASILRTDLPLAGEDGPAIIDGKVDTGDMGWFQVGPNCAKKLGKAFYKELDAIP